MRRYSTEITAKMYNTFMDEVFAVEKYAHYADKYEFKHSKVGVQIRPKGSDKDTPYDWLVYFIPLSKSGKLKSQLEISKIHTINFDEYMPLDHRYLKDEMLLLAEFWKSVDRDRDQTQLILLGNRVDPFCPFLSFFDIEVDIEKKKIRTYRDGTLAIQIYVNQEHRDNRDESKWSTLMAATEYAAYDQGGIMYGYKARQQSLSKNATALFSFISKGKEGTIWLDKDNLVFSDKVRKDLIVLVTDMAAAADDGRHYRFVKNYADGFREYYYENRMRLTNISLEPVVMSILRSR